LVLGLPDETARWISFMERKQGKFDCKLERVHGKFLQFILTSAAFSADLAPLGLRSDVEKGLAYFVIPGLVGHLVWDGSPFSYQEVEMSLSSLLIEKVGNFKKNPFPSKGP
jgi:hypothetical protein